jgi:hypothetical protein
MLWNKVRQYKHVMKTAFQKGQKVLTPEGEGLVEEIVGEEVLVKLNSGGIKPFSADQLQDNSDPG